MSFGIRPILLGVVLSATSFGSSYFDAYTFVSYAGEKYYTDPSGIDDTVAYDGTSVRVLASWAKPSFGVHVVAGYPYSTVGLIWANDHLSVLGDVKTIPNTGFMELGFHVDGFVSMNGEEADRTQAYWSVWADAPDDPGTPQYLIRNYFGTTTTTVNEIIYLKVPWHFGGNYIKYSFAAAAICDIAVHNPYACSINNDFSATAALTSFRLLGPDGTPVEGATVVSESGVDYLDLGGGGAQVPEPATITSIGLALLILLVRAICPASRFSRSVSVSPKVVGLHRFPSGS